MNLLFREKKSRKEKAKENSSISVQTRERVKYGFSANYTENSLYKSIRENIPLIDVCILKIRRLVGHFEVKCEDEETERLLNEFLAGIKVGLSGRGISDFIGNYLEQMLTYGSAIGEIAVKGREIAALYNAPLDIVSVKEEKPLELSYFVRKGFEEVKCPYPELILFSALNPEPGEVYGVSLLRGLPFISEILMKIYKTIGINWERVGNIRFAVSLKDDDSAFASERVKSVAEEWQKAMRSSEVNDFISLGEISVKAIGSDINIPESQIPVRQMLEQIVAKMGLPPFLLGLSWSSTERMSSQQADILTSEIESYRMLLSPVIDRIIKLWMRLEGRMCQYRLEWNEITMQDEVDHAKAKLMNAQADEIERKFEN
ncbi:MAG: phage portal protein [Ruminococcaceae bacterium]|nr:phage portal protein [Oscillospiraceae bacterium]